MSVRVHCRCPQRPQPGKNPVPVRGRVLSYGGIRHTGEEESRDTERSSQLSLAGAVLVKAAGITGHAAGAQNSGSSRGQHHGGSHWGVLVGRGPGEPLGAGLPSNLTGCNPPQGTCMLHSSRSPPWVVPSLSLTLRENKNMQTGQARSRPLLSEGPSAAMGVLVALGTDPSCFPVRGEQSVGASVASMSLKLHRISLLIKICMHLSV